MNIAPSQKMSGWTRLKNGGVYCLLILLFVTPAPAEIVSFTNLLAQGEIFGRRGEVSAALKIYSQAEDLTASNSAGLCVLTKHICDLMYATTSPDMQKSLAEKALACAQRALKADPQNATAHICVAVGYVKNFPYADNQTKVNYSRLIKLESERAIALDPKQDVAYYLLGRWHFGVANMNFLYRGLVKIIYGGLPEASDDEAIKAFKQAIALNPNRIIHHAELGKVYAATGQKELAFAEFKKCAGLKPVDRDDAAAQQEAAKLLDD